MTPTPKTRRYDLDWLRVILYPIASIPLMLWLSKGSATARRITSILAVLAIFIAIFAIKPHDATLYSIACVGPRLCIGLITSSDFGR